jgi:uncharacterized protein
MPPDVWLDDILNGRAPEPEPDLPEGPVMWIDADAMPRALRDIVIRASERADTKVLFVANILLRVPANRLVRSVQVEQGPDVADDYIAERARAGDLVITQDIPLAAKVVANGIHVLQTSGRELDEDSVQEALAMRNLKETLRESGAATGGPPPFGAQQKQRFANGLDRWLTKANAAWDAKQASL